MSLRLLRILVQADHFDRAEEILSGHEARPRWCLPMQDDRVMIEVVLPAAGNEPVLDDLENAFRDTKGFHLLFFPLEAMVPRMAGKAEEEDSAPDSSPPGEGTSRESPVPGGRPAAVLPGAYVSAQGPGESVRGAAPAEEERDPDAPSPGPAKKSRSSEAKPRGPEDKAFPDRASSSIPRTDAPGGSTEDDSRRTPLRINREELYTDLAEASEMGWYYVVMVALSAVVASAGLLLGDGAVIIGAMVIAPLIGPNIGVAFATTLGDLKLGRKAVSTALVGALAAFTVSFAAGLLVDVDPWGDEIIRRTGLTFEHLALALAAGAAGALAMGRGAGMGLVGVMVAVALLPPLANAGLLLGDGHTLFGIGALVLVAGNVVCVNLAATATFLVQGVRPNTWWQEDTRRRAVWTASILWSMLFLTLLAIVWIGWGEATVPVPDLP